MLRSCTVSEYEKYADFVYGLAMDRSRSGYPAYSDGIKTREMFMQRSKRAFSSATEDILLFEYAGAVEGWIHYYYLLEDKYLSTESFNIASHTEQALEEFLEFAQKHFSGYDLYLGYSTDNKSALAFMRTHGFELLDKSCNNTALLNEYRPVAVSGDIISITKENFGYFRALHSPADCDMYWNSDRIFAALDSWTIFVMLCGGTPAGSIYYTPAADGWFEIFGIDTKDELHSGEVSRSLLGKALNTAKARSGRYMTFFCDEDMQELVSSLGFFSVGMYVCFRKHLD